MIPTPRSSRPRVSGRLKLFRAITGTIAVLLSAVLVEGMFRCYLSIKLARQVAASFKRIERPTFSAYGIPPWVFDREQGFVFQQRPWLAANLRDGAFNHCTNAGQANRFGNVDKAPDTYAQADVRLMIVGSSFSMGTDSKGRLVNQVLMERLSERLGRSVHVLNFSRDSTGVLSYIDTARYKVDELKPKAIIALINAVGLSYRRHWRTVVPEGDGFRRMYISLDPVEVPVDPTRSVAQSQVISDNITDEWCRQLTDAVARGDETTIRNDPLVKALIARHEKLQREVIAPPVILNFWRPDVSFVLNRVRTGYAFTELQVFAEPVWSPITLDRYTDDPDFNAAITYLKATGIPVIPVHIPQWDEMRKRPDGGFAPGSRDARLASSLEQALGEPFVHLYRYYSSELKADPLRLIDSADNPHPSPLGVEAMAEALERMLLQHPRTAPLLSPEH